MTGAKRTGLPANGFRGEPLERALRRASDAPLRTGNRLTLLRNGPKTFDEWLEEIGRAERWIHLELFQFQDDRNGRRFAEALAQKAREGVRVRVLYDWVGSFMVSRSFWRELRRTGVEVRVVNPPAIDALLRVFERDHRKLLAVDGRYASTGGVSVADLWLERSSETGRYRRLLESGVRIFEYGGPMMHAKTTVADTKFSRVGSTNLNVAGLITNWEIDLFAEDAAFGARMERMFEEDLDDAREVILESRGPGRVPRSRPESPATRPEHRAQLRPRDVASHALATATRLGRTAFEITSREGLRRHERSVVAAVALATGLAGARFPKALAWPLAALLSLLGATGLLHAARPGEERPPESGAPRNSGRVC